MKCKYCNYKIQNIETTAFTTNGDLCCENCAEKYSMCASCGRIIMGHDNYDELTGNHFCDSCY